MLFRIFAGAILALLIGVGAALAGGGKPPVVVELYTSQGCSSCPPAEAYMQELAKRDDVLPLEFHVDYWDYIGWKDVFARPEFTERQRSYKNALDGRYVYTPQMVIDGEVHVVGSHRGKVEKLIRRSKTTDRVQPPVTLERQGKNLIVKVGAAKVSGEYDVTFVTFDKPHVTKVKRGENRGRTLVNANVVRELDVIGKWSGKPVEFVVSLEGKDGDGGCAVIVQKGGPGSVLVAASLPFEH